MNLREEIKKEIDDILVLAETNNDNTNETTDNILELVEKRIDILKQETEKERLGYDPDAYYARIDLFDEIKETLK